MKKNIVFAFHQSMYPSNIQIDLLFHKRGIFSYENGSYKNLLSPIEPIDWTQPILRKFLVCLPSVLMRFVMHPSIVAQYTGNKYSITVTTNLDKIKNSIVIIHKSIAMSMDILKAIKKNNNILIFDMLDFVDDSLKEKNTLLDGLIICSRRGYNYFMDIDWIKTPIFYITHCVDTRFPERDDQLHTFSPIYHGAPENAVLYPSLPRILKIAFCYPHLTAMDDWFNQTLLSNFFYAVRPEIESLRSKPFQKGFTASRLNANLLIHWNDGDVQYYLDEDYPYLIKEEITEEVVWRYILKARDDFGGTTWNKGLDILRGLRKEFSNEAISKEFWTMIERFS